MTDKEEVIIKNCPHVSYTAYGVYACRLYKPMDKNSFVKFGTCGANSTCPHKIAELKTQECEKYIKALEEIEKVWAKDEDGDYDFVKWRILNIISKAKDGKNEKFN